MQLTFEGKTIDQLAIELIQAYEPPLFDTSRKENQKDGYQKKADITTAKNISPGGFEGSEMQEGEEMNTEQMKELRPDS